ncbi:MAG: acyl-CoA thioesterase [Arachnia sp.]
MFLHRCRLRWSDLDAQGHVNNAVVIDYLQEARVAFVRGGPLSELLDTGLVIVGHRVEYLAPIEYVPHGVDVGLFVTHVGGARFEVGYELHQGQTLVGRARSVLCPFDFAENRPARLNGDQRGFLLSHLQERQDLAALETTDVAGAGTPTPITVRWSDLDAYGHVNNAKVFDYIQQARIEATTAWVPSMARVGALDSKYLWLVVRQDVDYLAQIGHRLEPYALHTVPAAIGRTSIRLASELVCDEQSRVYARGRTVLVCADSFGRPTELPAAVRSRLERVGPSG